MSHLTASHLVISSTTKLPYKQPHSNTPLLEDLVEDFNTSPERLNSNTVPSLKSVILVDNNTLGSSSFPTDNIPASISFSNLLNPTLSSQTSTSRPVIEEVSSPGDVINIQFTSGTTSSPKAACLTHRGILNNGFFIAERMGIGPGDVVCCPPPLFHCFGCVLG